ncbi:MAG: ABC transporter permease, partial [Clostridia bacterium]|nr:ABC transporter permease [Clostridia bacterium]
DSSIKNELNTLFNRYINCVEVFISSYNSSMCVEALNYITNKTQRSNLLGYDDISLYQQEELAVLYQYYIEKHVSSSDFANGLSVTHTSNGKINAYDFTFFVMSLFAVVVIIFAVYLSAHTISGEINNNTMRFIALRPIKRSSLFFGKYFAIIIMSFILLLFGTITSMIVGGIMYGMDSANILMIFNSNIVINTHPMIIIGVFVLSLLLIVAFYSALTMMFSTMFKSDLLALICGVAIYVVNLILPLFFSINSWLKFYPLANINLFAYLGTTSITTDSVLSKLFNAVIYQGMNIWISLIYVFGITTLLLLIGRHIFKKREL